MHKIYGKPSLMQSTQDKICYRIPWREELGRDFYGQKPRSGVRVVWVPSGTSPEEAVEISHARYVAAR